MKRKRLDAEHAWMDFTDSVKAMKSPFQEDEDLEFFYSLLPSASEPQLVVPRSKTGLPLLLRSLLPAALDETATVLLLPYPYVVCSLNFHLKVGVEESIVNAPRITTDHGFKSNLTFCVVCVFTLETDEWCVHNQLFNVYFEAKLKKNTRYNILIQQFKCLLRDDSPEKKLDKVILNVLKYFEREKQNQCVMESFLAVQKRTSLATGICERTISNVIKRNEEPGVTVRDDDKGEEGIQNRQPTKTNRKPRTRRNICQPKGQASGSSSAGNVEINENTRVGNLATAEVNFEDNTDDQTDNVIEVKAEADDADVHLGSREGTSEDNSNELGHDPLDYVDEIKTEVDDSDVYLPPTQASFEDNLNETTHDQADRVSEVKTEADEIDIKEEELVSSFPHSMKRKRLDAEHAWMDFTDSVKAMKSPFQEDEDLEFFYSLLPSVRSLNTDQKIIFRSKTVQLLQDLRNPFGINASTASDMFRAFK
ncbi:hypothetical protein GEV33_015356 [Tenebrio molitor]|nr:hypothetical protein GEV33_015356 [Tenebrio molitor]